MLEVNPATIKNALLSLIDIRRTNLGCEVQLPLYYPDGGSVTVTVTVQRDEYIVHDAGNGTMVLNASGVQMTRKLSQKIKGLAEHYGCEFSSGRVERRCSPEDIGVCAAIVANASRAVGDQLFVRQAIGPIDFRKEVLGKVRDLVGDKRFRENEEVHGESGYSYNVSAVILDGVASQPIGFVEPIKDHETATKKFREFWDISRSERFGSINRISLFDDSRSWDRADLIILQEVSNLVRISDAASRMQEILNA
ncbi:MAG: hypothetical protein DI533_15820 [Cereibacter sphaeroides]|uniref:DUF1828 domain-containing protein n=1 Tax=Cereibacter sphaeroides TaxID=1063 RepID=A0A2W5SCL7_CERSP|nr:MAG: hypothetical protein DI533_15820 [Cereibacter sphaeroides]